MNTAPVVIFVRPKAVGNVGAIARVMSNFGVSELRLVRAPRAEDAVTTPIDWALACRGQGILERATIFPTLAEALHDVHFSVGTTAMSLR